MPRDLSAMANDRTLRDMSSLSKVDDGDYSYEESMSKQDEDRMIATLSQRNKRLDELHPYTQMLSLSNIESCVVLENAAFPPNERASREKVSLPHECRPLSMCNTACGMCCSLYSSTSQLVLSQMQHLSLVVFVNPLLVSQTVSIPILAPSDYWQSNMLTLPLQFQYRLKHCGELCLGIFSSQEGSDAATAETSAPACSSAPQRKAVLLGHVISTKAAGDIVTDDDMAVPAPGEVNPKLGHKEHGRTICIHSLGVLPEYQHRGLGKTLMQAYLQRMESHNVADRVALIAHDHLVPYYEQFGFVNKGQSAAQFGGGGWIDMVKELKPGRVAADS